jgi:hypothetical protein
MNPEEGDVHAQLYFEKEQSCEVEEGISNLGRMHERQVADQQRPPHSWLPMSVFWQG